MDAASTFAVRGDRSALAQYLLCAAAGSAILVLITTSLKATASQASAIVAMNAFQITASVVFAIWLHRAYSNLTALGHSPAHKPALAVAFLFIPVANLILPYTVLREIWRASDPGRVRTLTRPPRRPVDVVSLWWALFIAATTASGMAAVFLTEGNAFADFALTIGSLIGAAAALVGVDMIRIIDTRQWLKRTGTPRAGERMTEEATPENAGWMSVVFPVVASLEREIASPGLEVRPLPARPPAPVVRTVARPQVFAAPKAVMVRAFLFVAGVLSVVQALATLVFMVPAGSPTMARTASWASMFIPVAIPVFIAAVGASIAFAIWLDRAYGNLRMFGTPPRSHTVAVRDFFLRAGDSRVLSEVWSMCVDETVTSVDLAYAWGRVWRGAQGCAALAVVLALVLPGTLAVFTVGATYALFAVAAFIGAAFCRRVSAAQLWQLTEPAEAPPPEPDPQ